MKKEDLKLCDVVELGDGSRYILIKGDFDINKTVLMNTETGCYLNFDYYRDDLTHGHNSSWDIMKVKHFKYSGDAFRTLGMIKNRSACPFSWDWERGLEYYNGKLVCVESSSSVYMTKGKICKSENGKIYDDEGDLWRMEIKNLEHLHNTTSCRFIELVED